MSDLESLAVMFEELSATTQPETADEWRLGYRAGLADAYRWCAETIRNEICRRVPS